jgi:hypothetical protein
MKASFLTALLCVPTVALAQADVTSFVGLVNAPTQVRLTWTNPSASTGFVIIRRAGTPPSWVPANPSSAPAVGAEVELGTFVIASVNTAGISTTPNATSGFVDSTTYGGALQAGTRYYYKIFNTQRQGNSTNYKYSSGIVPTSQGISIWPLGSTSAPLQWCSSVGLPNFARPVVQPGTRVMTIGQWGHLTSNATSNGAETWRPVPLQSANNGGSVQARPIYTTNFSGSGGTPIVVTGDQAGFAYRINASTGAEVWRRSSDQLFGTALSPVLTPMPIQSSPVMQFQGLGPNPIAQDLVFFASRTGGADNAVAAVRNDGTRHWLFRPAGLGDIVGEMFVDYANNRLWIPTTASADSLRVVSSATGAATAGPTGVPGAIGPISHGVILGDFTTETPQDRVVLVAAQSGVWAFRRSNMAYLWHVALASAPTSHVLALQGGFIVSYGNTIQRFRWTGGDPLVAPLAGETVVVNGAPTALRAYNNAFHFTAGNTLYTVDAQFAISGQYTLPASGPVSGLETDASSNRLFVGTTDGRVCGVSLPLPLPPAVP